jgi:hypothetical protein
VLCCRECITISHQPCKVSVRVTADMPRLTSVPRPADNGQSKHSKAGQLTMQSSFIKSRVQVSVKVTLRPADLTNNCPSRKVSSQTQSTQQSTTNLNTTINQTNSTQTQQSTKETINYCAHRSLTRLFA